MNEKTETANLHFGLVQKSLNHYQCTGVYGLSLTTSVCVCVCVFVSHRVAYGRLD